MLLPGVQNCYKVRKWLFFLFFASMEGKLNAAAVGYENSKLEETSLYCQEETGRKRARKQE